MLKRLRKAHPILFCVLAEVVFLASLFVTDLVFTIALVLFRADFASIDTYLYSTLQELVGAMVAVLFLVRTDRAGLLRRRGSGFFNGLLVGMYPLVFIGYNAFGSLVLGRPENGVLQPAARICTFLVSMAMVGVAEEFIFRGVIAQTLLEHFGTSRAGVWKACLLSGVLFGAAHLTNILSSAPFGVLMQCVFAASLGTLFAAIYFRTGNLWVTVFLHGAMDISSMLIGGLYGTTTVADAVSGYANGTCEADAAYQTVCKGNTGFRETVRVEYDPEQVSLDALLLAYFYVIDPTVENRQGNDIGSQYQTGVYYTNDSTRETVERIAEIERGRRERFSVEIGPLKNYYTAEAYHQNYLEKNPGGYCHIPRAEMELFSKLRIDPGDYQKPAAEAIRDKLTQEQYRVTQESGTERPFSNAFWDQFEKGIYVDVVTGEPLFSSTDKFESGCGWPAFTKPIEAPAVVELEDLSYGMRRTEVRSRAGDSHLGHVFTGDPESPNGVRYCINSASLRFVPYARMEDEGYGYLLYLFED